MQPHLRLTSTEKPLPYTARSGGGGKYERPPRDRLLHADKLLSDLRETQTQAKQRGLRDTDPTPLTVELRPEAAKLVESLENARSDISLLNAIDTGQGIRATIQVPPGKRRIIEAVLTRYKTGEDPRSGRPRHQDLVENIDAIRLATEADLWTDSLPFPDLDESLWWEVWVYVGDETPEAAQQRFVEDARAAGLIDKVRRRPLVFPERVVALVYGSHAQWQRNPRLFLHVAELRRAKELNADYVQSTPRFQRELSDEFLARIIPPAPQAPAVCLLDTGVARAHPLLSLALDPADTETLDTGWGTHDHDPHRHGTTMAGVALYGSLVDSLKSVEPVTLEHRLESVKILPPSGANDPESYGALTQEAIARMESRRPERRRVFNLAITADCRDGGLPSSWSAAVDQACMGGSLAGEPKLICISAGNLRDQIADPAFRYPMLNDSSSGIEDPGQAWNALTVGAMTERIDVGDDPAYAEYQPIAPRGDLSPTSRVSLAWPDTARDGWPIKPDIVMEGGNWARGPGDVRCVSDDLGLLTTTLHPTGALLTITHDTSPATAAAARMAARVWARYPDMRPETIRGLLVHSSRWTRAMQQRFQGSAKAVIQQRLRCYGYGVPDEHRALHSAENVVTLFYEGELQPYHLVRDEKTGAKVVKTKDMHLHELPWPVAVLQQLGHESVRLRITLSYFVEPSPGRRGWARRHRYASHGLRFAVFRPTDTTERFLARVSKSAQDGNDEPAGTAASNDDFDSGDLPWQVGPQKRGQGSIHSDWCDTTAANVAACNKIAIFPVTGWWRERQHLERWDSRARYSLIVTLETARQDVQLYTDIKTQMQITQAIATRS